MTKVQMIPIQKIRVLNPRARSRAKFREIVANIAKVGLKKPITVSPRTDGEAGYDLVCGQGRLEAYVALRQAEIPAIVVEAPLEQRYIMSLVENLARRNRPVLEMARDLVALKDRGYDAAEIATKVGLSDTYVKGLLRLFENGEERLVRAVERGEIPITIAMEIAESDDAAMQHNLVAAYESGALRGRALLKVRRLVEQRRVRGKGMHGFPNRPRKPQTPQDLVRIYRKEMQKQESVVKKARACEQQLRFATSALKGLLDDENFINLLRAEKLDDVPKTLAGPREPR